MGKFKAGDHVVCIDDSGSLALLRQGRLEIVDEVVGDQCSIKGLPGLFMQSRFDLVKPMISGVSSIVDRVDSQRRDESGRMQRLVISSVVSLKCKGATLDATLVAGDLANGTGRVEIELFGRVWSTEIRLDEIVSGGGVEAVRV